MRDPVVTSTEFCLIIIIIIMLQAGGQGVRRSTQLCAKPFKFARNSVRE